MCSRWSEISNKTLKRMCQITQMKDQICLFCLSMDFNFSCTFCGSSKYMFEEYATSFLDFLNNLFISYFLNDNMSL